MRQRIPTLAIIVGLVAAACGGATANPSPSAAGSSAAAATPSAAPVKVNIMVGGLSKQIYLPNKLTEALGYFKEEGLDVTLVDEPSGTDTETEVAAGHADFGSGSYDHTFDFQAQGKVLTTVVNLLIAPGEFVMVSNKMADTIKGPADFKGRNAGVTSLGSGTHTLMRAMAAQAGLKDGDVTYVKSGAGDTFIAAMKQGTIDVGITTQPTVQRLQTQGIAKLLVDLSKTETTKAALGGNYPFISLWARGDYLEKNNATAQKVVSAYVKTLKWIKGHTAADIAGKLPADYYAGDKDAYIKALQDSMGMFNPTGKLTQEDMQSVLKINRLFKKNLENVDLGKTYTSEFVDKAQ